MIIMMAPLSFYSYPPLIVGVLITLLGFYGLVRERASTVSLSFCLLTLSAATWLIGYGVVFSLRDSDLTDAWIRFTHIGVSFIPACVFLFILAILGKIHTLRHYFALCFFLSGLFCFTGLFFHSLIQGTRTFFWGPYAAYGPLSIPFLFYFFTVLIVSLGLLWKGYRSADSLNSKRRLKLFLAAFLIGYLASVDFIATYGKPVYPFGYLAVFGFIVLTAYSIFRYRLTALTPAFAADKILETMHGAIFVTDLEQRIRVLNSAACSLLGYTRDELFGCNIRQMMESPLELGFDKDGNGQATLKTRALCWLEDVRRHRMNWLRKDGRPIKVSVSASRLNDASGQVVGVVYAVDDITDQIEAEEMMREKENLEIKAQFVSVVSHELRTPLTAVKLSVDIVAQKVAGPINEDQEEYLERARANLDRLNRLINNVLDFQKLESGQAEFNRRDHDVNGMIKELGPTVESLAKEKGLAFVLDLAPHLPKPVFDKDRIGEVVMNFIGNAIKFTDTGTITVRTSLVPEGVRISVQDTGIGIGEEDIPKLFKNFSQIHNGRERKKSGTGLGLAISKKIIEQHQGRIGVKSDAGKGSEFFFILPLPADSPKLEPAAPVSNEGRSMAS